MTFVLVRKILRPVVSRVETSEKGIGLMGFVVSLDPQQGPGTY